MFFSNFEFLIAWRYLRAKRSDGGISAMTWISLIGITLAVMALIVTLAVRSGFRHEFVESILGANAHITLYNSGKLGSTGGYSRGIENYKLISEKLNGFDSVLNAAPLVKGQLMASGNGRNIGIEVFGIQKKDLMFTKKVVEPEKSYGDLENFTDGLALGLGVARELGVFVGDKVQLTSPDGLKTAFGTSPRVSLFEVVYIFQVGRYDIDRTRVYMPFKEAQIFFNRENSADEVEITLFKPESIKEELKQKINSTFPQLSYWTWRDSSGAFLQALEMEDNVMFLILSILVLIASMNIVSGLIMLVKNKGKDIGVLRTLGVTQNSILKIFFLCGVSVGVVGTVFGLVFGCLITFYIEPIFDLLDYILGGGVWDPSVRYLSRLPAKLELTDVISTVCLSLFLSFTVTIFPARRASKMNPVEALRHE